MLLIIRINKKNLFSGFIQQWMSIKLVRNHNINDDYCNNRKQSRPKILYDIAQNLNTNPKDLINS